MIHYFRRLLRRVVRLEPVTWLVLVAVFGGFMWLNFNTTRHAYLIRHEQTWHGGIREGFPLSWWDSGSEAQCAVSGDGISLSSRSYGGWQPLGICVGILMLGVALAGSAWISERVLQKRRMARTGLPAAPLNRRIRIRLATGIVTLLLLGATVALNLAVTTTVNGPGDGKAPPFSQSMGWPFTTYTASNPVLVNADRAAGAVLTAEQANAFLDSHSPLFWTRAHWSMSGIVLNTVMALLLVGAGACFCEWIGRRESLPKLASSSRQHAVHAQ